MRVCDRVAAKRQAFRDLLKPTGRYLCWNMRISYCIHASIVEFTMLGRRASELALQGLWDSGYGQLQ